MEERLDKTAFRKQTYREADRQDKEWRTRPAEYRLHAAYLLSLRIYGYDPEAPPAMDRALVTTRKQSM